MSVPSNDIDDIHFVFTEYNLIDKIFIDYVIGPADGLVIRLVDSLMNGEKTLEGTFVLEHGKLYNILGWEH